VSVFAPHPAGAANTNSQDDHNDNNINTSSTVQQFLSCAFPSKKIIALQATATMSSSRSDAAPPVGGMKGFFLKAGKSFTAGATVGREWSWWLIQKGGTVGLFLASTSMVILMPLIFEINREVQVCMYVRMYASLSPSAVATIAKDGHGIPADRNKRFPVFVFIHSSFIFIFFVFYRCCTQSEFKSRSYEIKGTPTDNYKRWDF
jgi:hypothetical protein